MSVDAVVTHHTDGFRSGVARFNELLAERLGVPLVSLRSERLPLLRRPLLSFKASELDADLVPVVEALAHGEPFELFLHEYGGGEFERRLVRAASRVHSGNREIAAAVVHLNARVDEVWTPGLLNDDRRFPDADLTVFSFGMAHKLRVDMFTRLRTLLAESGRSYALYVSAANHETSSLRDAEEVFERMHAIFPEELFFLGNLSDVAIADWLRRTSFFAAFFPRGVRANNTSVASAMERGAVVITNLDPCSPPDYVHDETVIDLEICERLPLSSTELDRIRAAALACARRHDWSALVERIRSD